MEDLEKRPSQVDGKPTWFQATRDRICKRPSSSNGSSSPASRNMEIPTKQFDGDDLAPGEIVSKVHTKINWFQATLSMLSSKHDHPSKQPANLFPI
jgi:hypothetical protein